MSETGESAPCVPGDFEVTLRYQCLIIKMTLCVINYTVRQPQQNAVKQICCWFNMLYSPVKPEGQPPPQSWSSVHWSIQIWCSVLIHYELDVVFLDSILAYGREDMEHIFFLLLKSSVCLWYMLRWLLSLILNSLLTVNFFVQTCFRVFIGTEVAVFQLIKRGWKKWIGATSHFWNH